MSRYAIVRGDGSVRCVTDAPNQAREGERQLELMSVDWGARPGPMVLDEENRTITVDQTRAARIERARALLEEKEREDRLVALGELHTTATPADRDAIDTLIVDLGGTPPRRDSR